MRNAKKANLVSLLAYIMLMLGLASLAMAKTGFLSTL